MLSDAYHCRNETGITHLHVDIYNTHASKITFLYACIMQGYLHFQSTPTQSKNDFGFLSG